MKMGRVAFDIHGAHRDPAAQRIVSLLSAMWMKDRWCNGDVLSMLRNSAMTVAHKPLLVKICDRPVQVVGLHVLLVTDAAMGSSPMRDKGRTRESDKCGGVQGRSGGHVWAAKRSLG